jgi:hypothetical protein
MKFESYGEVNDFLQKLYNEYLGKTLRTRSIELICRKDPNEDKYYPFRIKSNDPQDWFLVKVVETKEDDYTHSYGFDSLFPVWSVKLLRYAPYRMFLEDHDISEEGFALFQEYEEVEACILGVCYENGKELDHEFVIVEEEEEFIVEEEK